ncbi:unnamed protein product [Calypogeia fissa]
MATLLGLESDFRVLSGVYLMKRFDRYFDMYKRALNLKNSICAHVTIEELQVGVTMEFKDEKMCPHVQRMDELFGERPNVLPPWEFSIGLQNGNGEIILSAHIVGGSAAPSLEWCTFTTQAPPPGQAPLLS